jgi:NADP-dependent 3-hydroxy acid dehydrogenase YdfG
VRHRGIGAAIARALTGDGYRVALLARRLDRIQALADELGHGAVAIDFLDGEIAELETRLAEAVLVSADRIAIVNSNAPTDDELHPQRVIPHWRW